MVHLTCVLLGVFAICSNVIAQSRNNTTAATLEPTIEVHLSAARKLAREAQSLEPPKTRVELLIRLSDTVWDWDQLLARNLLATSFDLIAEIAKESELKRSNVTDDADLLFGRLINVAASHDETLARELTRKRNLILEHSGRSTQQRPASLRQLSALLLSESVKHLKSDRKRAQELFRQSISSYVTQEHFWFLKTIRKESPQTADVFFAEAIDILNQRELREANEVMVLASYLFSPTETVAYDLVGDYNAANSFGNVSLNPSQPVLAKKFRVGWGGIQGHQSPRMIWGDDYEITLTQLVNNHRFTVVNLFDRFCTECPTGERLETMNKLARKQRQDLAIAAVFLPIPRYLI